jgi:hypothetical protein
VPIRGTPSFPGPASPSGLKEPPCEPEKDRTIGPYASMRTHASKSEVRIAERLCGRGEGKLRALRLTTISMIVALTLATPAMAQEPRTNAGEAGASSQQYGVDSSKSLADGVRDASDTAGRGADAINDALDDAGPQDGATGSADGKVVGLTVLPETGGVSVLAPGVLLVGAGLLVRRITS